MKHLNHILIASLLITACGDAADSFSVGTPVFGAVFDARSQSIRRIIGVPGASSLADTLINQVDVAEIAPNGTTALALQGGQLYAISALQSSTPIFTAINPMPATIDRIVWNRGSSAAAIYSAASSSLTVLTNFSNTGADQTTIALSSLTGTMTALALDDSGSFVIVAYSGSAAGVYLVSAANPPALLALLANPTSVALIHHDRDVLVSDSQTVQIFEVRDIHGSQTLAPFANLPVGATNPVGLSASPDGRLIFVADQTCLCVGVYQYSTRLLINQLAVGAPPAFLKPLPKSPLFLVNAPSDNATAFWMLNASETPGTFFVSGGSQ